MNKLANKLLIRPALLLGVFLSISAEATWSIVAVDPESGEVGLAAATCGLGVHFIAAAAPGAGVVAAQGATSFKGRDMARDWMSEGLGANEVLSRLIDPELYDGWFEADFSEVQYGIASLTGRPEANHLSGESLEPWFGGIAGDGYSVQGNILRSENVVVNAAREFEISVEGDCRLTLAERLLRALEAGRDAGGDRRCPANRPSHSAVLLIADGAEDNKGQRNVIRLVTPKEFGMISTVYYGIIGYKPDDDAKEPVQDLRERYNAAGGGRCQVQSK